MSLTIGQIVHSFFEDYLKVQKGLRPASVRSYRDALRLFLLFVARDAHRKLTRLSLQDLTYQRTLRFLLYLEKERHNQIRSRNQRLAALRTFFEYVAKRAPELLPTCQQVALIPVKRTVPQPARFLEQEEITTLFRSLPNRGQHALRNRTLLLFLYNTGARVQEVCDLRLGDLDLRSPPRVRLRGKGDKWRTCRLWTKTAEQLRLLTGHRSLSQADTPVFVSRSGRALTRFGIYKIVRRCVTGLGSLPKPVSPHVFRHYLPFLTMSCTGSPT